MGQGLANVFSSPGGARCSRPVRGPWEGGPDRSQGMGSLSTVDIGGLGLGREGHGWVVKVLGRETLGHWGVEWGWS